MRTEEEIAEAQQRVGQALARAHVSEDRLVIGKIREHGEQFVRSLVGLVRLQRIHAANNEAFTAPSLEAAAAIVRLMELLGVVEVSAIEGQVYVNDIRVRFASDLDTGAELGRIFAVHEIAGFVLKCVVTAKQALGLAILLGEPAPDEAPREALSRGIRAREIPGIKVTAPLRARYASSEHDAKDEDVSQAYAHSMAVLVAAWQHTEGGSRLRPLRFRRMISDLTGVEVAKQLQYLALGAQDMRTSEYARHSFSVASVALAIGRCAGLSADVLSDLGLAGFFHDVGYQNMTEAPSDRDPHAIDGAIRMLNEQGFTTAKLRRATVCLYHHASYSASPRPPLLARIVHIADDYDTLTRIRG
ncbi:MAG: HD domain-containing protein, partial [Deltaproteobacteria bacterium]